MVVSDIHGNLDAFGEVLNEKHDFLIFAGDSVDYGPQPSEVVDDLMKNCDKCVMGNHDAANVFSIDCRSSEKYHNLSVKTREYFKNKLSKQQLNFLGLLPMFQSFNIDGLKFTVVHGSLQDFLYDYVSPDTDEKLLLHKFRRSDDDYIVFGHTHIPMLKKVGKTTFINPGSVGQPRDGDPRSSYAIIDTQTGDVKIIRREYPVENTVKKIMSLEIEESVKISLAEILRNGGLH